MVRYVEDRVPRPLQWGLALALVGFASWLLLDYAAEPPEPPAQSPPDVLMLGAPLPPPTIDGQPAVFVTPDGSRYHADWCGHLHGRGRAVTLDQVGDREPCKDCSPHKAP